MIGDILTEGYPEGAVCFRCLIASGSEFRKGKCHEGMTCFRCDSEESRTELCLRGLRCVRGFVEDALKATLMDRQLGSSLKLG
jgi:hypothetical protein